MQNNYENLEFGKQLTFTMNSNKKSTFVFHNAKVIQL